MITRVKDGSIIIISNEILPDTLHAKTGLLDAISNPDFTQYHGMVYFNRAMYHSQAGDHFEGVRSHTVEYVMERLASGMPLGKIFTIDCVDDDLSQRLMTAMARWDPVEFLQKKRAEPRNDKDEDRTEKLPIPFMNYYSRNADPKSQSAKCELYRAIRAYQRNHVDPPAPLSKKGISCDAFIAYSFKAAIIESLFPDGLPEEILQKMTQIDAFRSENKTERHNKARMMKLSDVGETHPYLDELMQLVEKHAPPAKHRHIEFLKTLVKSAGLDHFCRVAVTFPEFWQPAGVMFGYKDKDANTPYIMSYDVYQAFSNNPHHTPVDMLLSETSVEKAITELNPAAKKDKKKSGYNKSSRRSVDVLFNQSSETATPTNSPAESLETKKKL